MAEQKLYAVRLKDGSFDFTKVGDSMAWVRLLLRQARQSFPVKRNRQFYRDARVVPVRLVEDTDE